MKPLSIVAYFDGRLGHEKQTRSILQEISGITATHVINRIVRISPAASCSNWAAYLLSGLWNMNAEKYNEPVDLIIGTGTHTHIPMLLEKKSRNKTSGGPVRVVTCMSPDPLLLPGFDLCFIPLHDDPIPRKNIFLTLGPPSPRIIEKRDGSNRGLILVGGVDRKSHKWDTGKITVLIKNIVAESQLLLWTVSSSPRTPEDTCRKLENMAEITEKLTFYRSIDTPAGWIEEQYALHDTAWVTADSISMVYEALTAGCAVGILPVEWLRQKNKFQKSLTNLHERNMIVTYEEWKTGAKTLTPPGEPFNEAGRCARELLKRWWPDRLQ